MKNYLLTLLLSLLLTSTARAELSNCNGVWTNDPCEGNASSKLEEKDFKPQDPQKRLQSKKQQILHDLRMKELNSERTHKIDIAIDPAETVCNDPATTLEDCQEKVTELRNKIDDAVRDAREIEIEEKKIEAEKAEAKTKAENNTTTITIIKERRRHPWREEEYNQIPGTYRRERKSEHSGFNIGGTVAGSNATISGNVGESSSETTTTTVIEGQ